MRLGTGGVVVGLLNESAYAEGAVDLQPGDVFVGYMDGISEAMTTDGEEWGEQRMIASSKTADALCADEMSQGVMRAADAFLQSAPPRRLVMK